MSLSTSAIVAEALVIVYPGGTCIEVSMIEIVSSTSTSASSMAVSTIGTLPEPEGKSTNKGPVKSMPCMAVPLYGSVTEPAESPA